MDLSIKLEDSTLYIRVATLIRSTKGYLFEKHKDGYIFAVGGKIKLNETSLDAAKREVMEELNFEVNNLKLISLMENFYGTTHEYCFVYEVEEIFDGIIPEGFVEVALADLGNFDLKPVPMVDLLTNKNSQFAHIIIK